MYKKNKFETFWKIRYINMFKYSWKSYDMKLLTRYSHYKQYQLLLYLDALFSWKKSYFCQSFSWHGNFLSTIKFLVHIMTHTLNFSNDYLPEIHSLLFRFGLFHWFSSLLFFTAYTIYWKIRRLVCIQFNKTVSK